MSWRWRDVERLFSDLKNDGFEVQSVETNASPLHGKKIIIEVSDDE